MIKRSFFTVGVVALLTVMVAFPAWAVPGLINYQGKLTDSGGNALNGMFSMTFRLYNASSGGSSLWNEIQSVQVIDGIYSVELGSVSPFSSTLFDSAALYLEVIIGSETLSPRQRLTSTAFSMKAGDAETVAGLTPSEIAAASHSHDGSDIATGTVEEVRIDSAIARDSEITWGNLANIPAGFADGVDNTGGVTTETDPTVLPSVKDGVSWGEISSIPSGFADGVDNNSGGDINGVTAGTGLSGGGTSGTVTLNVRIPFSLSSAYNGGLISASNTLSAGTGVYGEATYSGNEANYGGYFSAGGYRGYGVYGKAANSANVTNYGGYFSAEGGSGRGVAGVANGYRGTGVYGEATYSGNHANYGGYFSAKGYYGYGVYGDATYSGNAKNYGGYFSAAGYEGTGVYGKATYSSGNYVNYGGYFSAAGVAGRGVAGVANGYNGTGVYGRAANSANVTNYGGYFSAEGGYGRGVYGIASGTYGRGVYGTATSAENSATNYGGYFSSRGYYGYGVCGIASGTYGYGVYGYSSSDFAGYFDGPVRVTGSLSKLGGGFQIDHPLDPENKYLNHSFVESPDMKNIYDGVAVLDANGERWVELPEWFEALNKDFRYQLTCIGSFAQVYIAQEISDSRFKIAGGNPGMKVSWQVTGIRQDPWAEANRIPVEEDKAAEERGFYLSPESYGQPEEKGIEWGRNPEMMQQMKEEREKSVESQEPSAG